MAMWDLVPAGMTEYGLLGDRGFLDVLPGAGELLGCNGQQERLFQVLFRGSRQARYVLCVLLPEICHGQWPRSAPNVIRNLLCRVVSEVAGQA
jgi:hypothetical protein